MAEQKITRDIYRQYAHKIVSVLKNEEFYEQFKKRVDKGTSSFKLSKKRLIQDISIDWIDTIEEILPNLDTIVRNPRKFIVQEEDIVDVSLARSISTESVKFLAQHTNMISKVDKDGMVTPSKILNITKEESFEIYENRFIYTLLLKLKDFVTMRYDKIKKASATQDVLELNTESRFGLPSKKVTYRTEYFAQLSFDEVMRLDPDTLTKIERVAKIDRIITDFLSSSFAKSMRNSAPVRPPIMRTNVILKEPNFKKALTLWQFIETYNATGGFSTSDEVEEYDVDSESVDELRNMVALNTMLFESMYDQCETDMDMEDKEFGDFLRVGDMDFQKDEINRDEYGQKLDEQIENDEEEENLEETHVNETEEPAPTDKPQEPEEDEEKEKEPQTQLAPEEQSKKGKEVVQEVEKRVEVEVIKELPPKADQEEPDVDADAEKFDKHLFEVRKLYKKPADDKLTKEDIEKVKDAIDRCLNAYGAIKQEQAVKCEREYRIRRRKEDMAKRASMFAQSAIEFEKSVSAGDKDKLKFGMDPFAYQRAKIAEAKREQAMIEERKKRLEEIEQAKLAEQERIRKEEEERAEKERAEQERIRAEEERLREEERVAEEERLRAEEEACKDEEEILLKEEDDNKDIEATDSEVTVDSPTEDNFDSQNGESADSQIEDDNNSQRDEVADSPTEDDSDNQNIEETETGGLTENDSNSQRDEVPEVADTESRTEDNSNNQSNEVAEVPKVPRKKAAPKKPKRPKQIDVVDESKVSIGTISFKKGSGLPFDDLFVSGGSKRVNLKNRAETEPQNKAENEKTDK